MVSYKVVVNKKGTNRTGGEKSGRALRFLYRTVPGRLVLKAAVRPSASRLGGRLLSSRISTVRIKHFIRKSGIDMSEYPKRRWYSFNDFFTRKILPGKRPIDMEPGHLISPCDGKLSAYIIDEHSAISIKGCSYTVRELLQNAALAKEYEGGYCLVFRLAVNDYHRYCYIDNAEKSRNIHICGELHTVQPISARYHVLARNDREYTIMATENFGRVVQVEVGALMVGKISNLHGACRVRRGEEKGMFEFGGSTIVLLLEKGRVNLNESILDNTRKGWETVVKMGEYIAVANR